MSRIKQKKKKLLPLRKLFLYHPVKAFEKPTSSFRRIQYSTLFYRSPFSTSGHIISRSFCIVGISSPESNVPSFTFS